MSINRTTFHPIADDILVVCGSACESVATAFISGREAVLIDCLASIDDAQALRQHLEYHYCASVSTIVLTHYMDDHTAGLPVFPEARVLASHLYSFTHASWRKLAVHFNGYREPDELIDQSIEMTVGNHRLRIFGSPGKTVCMLNVDVPDVDLIVTGDNLTGRIACISNSTPQLLDAALARLEATGRRHLVAGHQGVFDLEAVKISRAYLKALGERVRSMALFIDEAEDLLLSIRIEDCLPNGVEPTNVERHWHAQNLIRIIERRLFRAVRSPNLHS